MNYDKRIAGNKMDALIAERVMGWKEVKCLMGGNQFYGFPDDDFNRDVDEHKKHGTCGFPSEYRQLVVPRYSKRISDAWEVVDKLTDGGNGYFELTRDFGGRWDASFCIVLKKEDPRREGGRFGSWEYKAEGCDAAPLAICRAALKAIEESHIAYKE